MASSSDQASSSSSCPASYHVFLSFMAEEIGTTFADHLYTALDQAGFHTFRGDEELEMGGNIESQLQKAIQQSRISVIIFSKRYISSSRCLEELVMILEHKRTCSAHHVLPVFYNVNPSDVRTQTGSLEETFVTNEQRAETEEGERKHELKSKVDGWKDALKEAADLAGMNLLNQADGHESKFIQNIIKVVGGKLSFTTFNFALHPVGIDFRARSINMWLEDESIDVGILAICGMGGMGKTTIARFVYNLSCSRFEGSSFLASVAEVSKQENGIISMQRQLLSDILKGRDERINSVHEGSIKIKDILQCKRVLLVLDDVDTLDQYEAVLGICNQFYSGSRIIITTRNEQLVKAQKVWQMHRLEILSPNESLELFSWHAFSQNHPYKKFKEMSKRLVHQCGGLPLAIKILGSSLCGRTIDEWESQLMKLKTIPENEILERLRISHDSLDDHDQDIFLHISCFFVGCDEDYVVQILDGCGLHTKVGLQNLIDRCLLTIDEYDLLNIPRRRCLRMHQLLQEMGREIVRQESPKELGKRSRIWNINDSLKILREKMGTAKIEGFSCNKCESTVFACGAKRKHPLQEKIDNSFLSNLGNAIKRRALGNSICHFIDTTSRNSTDEALETNAFVEMRNLKLLQLNYAHLCGSYENFPKELIWLCWHGFPLQSIPKDFLLNKLVILEMPRSNLKNIWNGTKNLQSLKILDLSGSRNLTKTPNFLFATNIEKLLLENCTSLVEIHKSIGLLERLDFLNLRNCKSLSQIPRSIGRLKSLKTLDVSGCSNLDKFPTEMGNIESLKELHANGIGKVRAQCWFMWNSDQKPKRKPKITWTTFPQSLVYLSLDDCNLSDEDFPSNLSNFISLQKLNLSGNPIYGLPDCIKGLPKLHTLYLNKCRSLRSITGLQKLTYLYLKGCELLERVCFQSYPFHDVYVHAKGCENLNEIQGKFKLEALSTGDPKIINNLGLLNFKFVRETNVALRLPETDAFRKGEKFFPLQVCHSPCFKWAPRRKRKFSEYLRTVKPTITKRFEESRVFRTYIWGGKVPNWFNFQNRGESISFTVPPNLDSRIQGLTVCFVYAWLSKITSSLPFDLHIGVANKTKGIMWKTEAWIIGMQEKEEDEDITMLNYWKLDGDELTAGDELVVSVFIVDKLIVAKEIGIRLLYEAQEERNKHCNEKEKETQNICADKG